MLPKGRRPHIDPVGRLTPPRKINSVRELLVLLGDLDKVPADLVVVGTRRATPQQCCILAIARRIANVPLTRNT